MDIRDKCLAVAATAFLSEGSLVGCLKAVGLLRKEVEDTGGESPSQVAEVWAPLAWMSAGDLLEIIELHAQVIYENVASNQS